MQEEKKYNLELTLNELNTVLQGLGNLPYLQVNTLINSILTKVNE